jgi:UDP-3-O-[3-hydroxymyristoyl] glucosamine N-acyltransferase
MLPASTRIRFAPSPLATLAGRFGGHLVDCPAPPLVTGLAAVSRAWAGALVPVTRASFVAHAGRAREAGASLLVSSLLHEEHLAGVPAWVHPRPMEVVAQLLREAEVDDLTTPPGEGTIVAPTAVIYPGVRLGARVRVGAGAVLGAPGFGFLARPDGAYEHTPQLGGVVIEDDVWIGACCTIDAGTLGPTWVRRGAKLDSHVHVGHNSEVGEDSLLCAQVGLAGSVVIGRSCVLGGQAGVADHVRIGAGARVAAKSGVIGDIAAGAVVGGYPAVERAKWLRGLAVSYRRARSKKRSEE